jgi:hypothetical protein
MRPLLAVSARYTKADSGGVGQRLEKIPLGTDLRSTA